MKLSPSLATAISFLVLLCAAATPLACGSGGGGSNETEEIDGNLISTDEILTLVTQGGYELVGAHAFVNAGGRAYRFQYGPDDDSGFQTASCSLLGSSDSLWTFIASFSDGDISPANDRISFFTPTGFAGDPRNDLSGAGVQFGVYDAGTGEEWSSVPNGRSVLRCEQSFDVEDAFDQFLCELGWTGRMVENFPQMGSTELRNSAGVAQIVCLFGETGIANAECLDTGCDDGNPCTWDYCQAAGCAHLDIGLENASPQAESSWRDALDIYSALNVTCDADGNPGRCAGGVCVEDECDESCGGFQWFSADDTCAFDYCDGSGDEAACTTIEIASCTDADS